jgi:hypothetical protein
MSEESMKSNQRRKLRSAVFFVALILSAPAPAQFDAQHPPPDWMERGFEAAIFDPASIQDAIKQDAFLNLSNFVPSDHARAVIDKLLPLLGDRDSDVREAAARALGQLAPGERAGPVIDKLLPLLGDKDSAVQEAAARALGQLAPGERAGPVIDKLLPLLRN